MENQNKNIYFQNLSQLNIPSNLNFNVTKTYSSPYQDILFLLSDNNIIYQGKYISQGNQKKFIFEKIKSENKSNNNYISNKFILCDFTSEHIYLITKEKNEIFVSDYNFPYTINNLSGILQKKKIKAVSCGINSSIFLTYGGMVYTNSEQNKESQILINDLLEYNISNIYAGGYHFFCKGKKRNLSDENESFIFSWGDNSFAQCGYDNINTYLDKPKIIFKNIAINNISLGKNHTMILTNNLEVIIFGDNQFFQCSNENKQIIKLVENDNILPLTEVNYYTSPIDYLIKNNEIINKIEAKGDSSLIITHKKSIILKGKITEGKETIFKLNGNNNNEINSDTNTVVINNNILFCFGGDNYFLVISDGKSNENYYEIKSGIYNTYNTANIGNLKKLKLFNDSNSENIISKISNDDNALLKNLPKFKNSMHIYSSKYKTISAQDDLTFEELKKDQYQSLNTTSDLSEASLTELRSYISLLGISLTSSYNDSNLSFRPKNLPPKSKEEENLHRQMVYQNRQMYINLLKQKKALQEENAKLMEQKHLKEKSRAEFWNTKIIPNWSKMKNNKNIKKYFYEGIPSSTRGKIWALCIGNKFCITKEYYDIEATKSIQLLIKLNKNNNKKKINNSNNTNNNKINSNAQPNINIIESDNSSMSLSAKKFYSKFIKQTLDKEKSINLIDLDIERTFSSMGIFKNESQLGNNLREILRIFVVARPDIGYVQGLSYIAGTLLLQMDKFSSFVCFMNIILSPNILPFYRLDEENIKKRLEIFNEILKLNLPKLYKHFEENEILPEHYLLEWFMTLFTRNLHIDLALRIWDIYMIEGIITVYKSAVVIFKLNEKKYLSMDFADIMNNLRNLEKNIINEEQFVEDLNNIKFSDKILNKIHQLNEEYLIYE